MCIAALNFSQSKVIEQRELSMPTHKPVTASSAMNAGVLLDLPRVDGVDPQDPAGTLPPDAKQVGIVCVIDRWPNFPPPDARIDRVEIFIEGDPNPVAWGEYGAADNAPEFRIRVDPAKLPNVPTFQLNYTVRSTNLTTSPSRRLTFAIVAPPQLLKEAVFPDANLGVTSVVIKAILRTLNRYISGKACVSRFRLMICFNKEMSSAWTGKGGTL